MGFLLQLRLLVWKNLLLRKRQWGRLLIEIVWPLLLFMVLVLVRLRGLRKSHHQCYFDEKSMPSTGLVPFARSFICTFNNTCHMDVRNDYTQAPTYNDTFINELITDVETALEKNFNEERVEALNNIFDDLKALPSMAVRLRQQLLSGVPIQGMTVESARSLLKDPDGFALKLLDWSGTKGILVDLNVIRAILVSRLRPDLVSPSEMLTMVTDPRTAICDPTIVSKFIEPRNMTNEEVQENLKPFCNLSLDDAFELLNLVRDSIDWTQVTKEVQEFSMVNGKRRVSLSDWEMLVRSSEDIRADLLEEKSVMKVFGDVSNLLRTMSDQMTLEMNNDTATNDSLFLKNISTNGRLAFAAFQRVVCGRNMSSDQLFSDGGAVNYFDGLRDQLKEKDDKPYYRYDNATSKECNDMMKGLEENRLTGFLWSQMKPFIRGKILYTPDTPATRRLVAMVNDTFRPIEDVRRLSKAWIDTYSERIKGLFMDKENQEFMKTLFTSEEEGGFMDRLMSNNITKALNEQGTNELVNETAVRQQLREYFAGNYTERWEDTFKNVDHFVRNVSTYLGCFDFDKFVAMENEHELEVKGIQLISENKLWAGLVFVDFPQHTESDELPDFIRYKIRTDSDKVDNTRFIEDRLTRPGPRRRPGIDLKYLYYGFAYLQDMIEHSIIAVQSGRNRSDLPGITLQQMPYPCYIEDRFIIAIARTFPLFMTLAWIYSASMIVKSIVFEKEQRLKETMRVMGLGNGVHWVSWFIDSFAMMAFSAFLLTLILSYGDILTKSDPTVVFCFMLAYTVSTISLCFLMSTFFNKANVAAAAAGILFFCFYLPYSFMVVWERQLSSDFKMASCLVSNIAFGFGCAYLSHYEESGVGVQWDNVMASPLLDDHFSMGKSMIILLLDSVIYFVLTWYIEAVWPGQYGVRKPFYFFLTRTYWLGGLSGQRRVANQNSGNSIDASLSEEGEGGQPINVKNIEPEPSHLSLGVSVQHLSKVYGNGKVAVEDLNLNFYEGQITSFLGHNGAGKTTTISILTGLFSPSAGTAKINGLDIRKDMDTIRQSLGTCPQHNVLFDHLTVFEHLWFYARLKGRQAEEVLEEADTMIQDLGLPHKRDEVSTNLSGGMQRKLSIASAFVGGSRTVVLDEPTAGVDPYSRRSIWDLLMKYKENRTIILTTHFMDEADLLGDRIAIINNGKLVTVGSSLFLRARFGNGYYLTLVKEDADPNEEEKEMPLFEEESEDDEAEVVDVSAAAVADAVAGTTASPATRGASASVDASVATLSVPSSSGASSGSDSIEKDIIIDDEGISDIAKTNGIVINPSSANFHALTYPTTKFIQKYVPNARLLEQIGSEIIYVLPTDDLAVVKKFEQLFTELDRYMAKLKIKSYGLSDTTLEEIFLKVASNGNDGEIHRHHDEGSDDYGHVANRVRSASESSGLRHLFGNSANKKSTVSSSEDETDKEASQNEDAASESPSKTKNMVPRVKQPVEPSYMLILRHLMALEIKRFHHSKRNQKGVICEIFLPAFFVCLAMLFTLIMPPLEEQRKLEIHPWMYPTSGKYPTSTFYANQNPKGDWPRRYEEQLFSRVGMGTRCVSPDVLPDLPQCMPRTPNISSFAYPPEVDLDHMKTKECNCDVGTQQCPAGAEGIEPPKIQMPSYDIMFNLTGRNLSDYLMKTRGQFLKRRYGGFELGVRNPLANRNISELEIVTDRWLKATNMGKSRIDSTVRDLVFGNIEDAALSSSMFDNVRVWFNNKGWAASMAYMNAMNNVILRASVKTMQEEDFSWNDDFKDESKFGMSVINHPMNFTKDQLDTEVIRQIGISLLHAVCVIFAMSFVPASFVLFHIEERESKVKHLQFVSGVKPWVYWVASFLWDMSLFIFTAFLCVLIFLAFDAQAYVSEDNLPWLVIIMFLYGFSTIPLMYPSSFIFSVPSSAFVTLSCTNLFIGIITTTITFVLENFEDDELKYVGSILKELFLIFPHYCLGRALMDMATEMNINLIVAKFGLMSVRNRYAWDFLGKYMFCMTVQGILFFLFTMMIEYKPWTRCWRRQVNGGGGGNLCVEADDPAPGGDAPKSNEDIIEEDEDVARERLRVEQKTSKDNPNTVFSVKNLTKKYNKKSLPAVDRLTFGVKRGECFGLLGVNGAGKTTTFKMLTGDTQPTAGEGYVNGSSILTELQKVRKSLGYCPQFDALNPLLTGREHLRLYARLRGLDEEAVKKVADWGLKKLGLVAYADRCAGTYSGGNKRKLSTAIALVGGPSIVFLDEPTTGMDPGARRFLWNCILEMIRGGQSVVLTSHSMEECEALCTRLGIMVNGRFQCLGSAQHLKNRFGSGYTLTLRSTGSQSEAVLHLKELVTRVFPLAELKEEHFNQLQYQLPLSHTKLPLVFREMERAKNAHKTGEPCYLEDYSITQTTLDEVFIRFASKQTELREESERQNRHLSGDACNV